MFDDFAGLRPLKEAAELIAAKADWPHLYNPQQLSQNTVSTAAAAYYEDL